MTKKSRRTPIPLHPVSLHLHGCPTIPQNIAEGVSAVVLMFLHGAWVIYTASLLGREHCNEFPLYRSYLEQESWFTFYIWGNGSDRADWWYKGVTTAGERASGDKGKSKTQKKLVATGEKERERISVGSEMWGVLVERETVRRKNKTAKKLTKDAANKEYVKREG